MNREQKIEFLKGLANSTRSISELVDPDPIPISYDLATMAELQTFLDIVRPDRGYHGPHVSTKIFTESQANEILSIDLPKRSHIKKELRGISPCIRFDTVYYKDNDVLPFTHIHYSSWNNRSISVFPTNEELMQLQEMTDKDLIEYLERKITELLNPKTLIHDQN